MLNRNHAVIFLNWRMYKDRIRNVLTDNLHNLSKIWDSATKTGNVMYHSKPPVCLHRFIGNRWWNQDWVWTGHPEGSVVWFMKRDSPLCSKQPVALGWFHPLVLSLSFLSWKKLPKKIHTWWHKGYYDMTSGTLWNIWQILVTDWTGQ